MKKESSRILSARALKKFKLLQTLRIIAGVCVALGAANILELRTDSLFIALSALIGTWHAGKLSKKGSTFLRITALHVVVFTLLWVTFKASNILLLSLYPDDPSYDFLVPQIASHALLLCTLYSLTFLSTWVFWHYKWAVSAEACTFAAALITLLAGHRRYNLDAPKTLNDFAWGYGFDPQLLIIGIGVSALLLLVTYLALAQTRPLFGTSFTEELPGKRRLLATTALSAFLLLLLFGYVQLLKDLYSKELSRATNGVGMEKKEEGQSPLGFHSATGKTKQPAALVRLEGDYTKNPWAPMLYLREGALSEFNGKEFVLAKQGYDSDIPGVPVGSSFVSNNQEKNPFRDSVTQSVYLLAKHSAMFAIDFPTVIRPIKNPDPERFILSYQALSNAPVVNVQEVIGESVINSKWTKEVLNHYLKAPGSRAKKEFQNEELESTPLEAPIPDEFGEDLRYKALARQIVDEEETPVAQAAKIVQYLSQVSIYTRQPGHELTNQGDPVAPYLFSEKKRGYCVHFAHAAVYMMRLLGIPSRIGTGYLTDTTYAKDGHILLHLGDRHAWPEIFVEGFGWVVLDVTPAQAENEQEIVPDEKLLEELMSKIDPVEDLITPPVPQTPERDRTSVIKHILSSPVLWPAFGALLGVILLLKLWVRFGYKLSRSRESKLKRYYISLISTLFDLGYFREYGETRIEYAKRMQKKYSLNLTPLTEATLETRYEKKTSTQAQNFDLVFAQAQKELATSIPLWKRTLSFFNPVSLAHLGRW